MMWPFRKFMFLLYATNHHKCLNLVQECLSLNVQGDGTRLTSTTINLSRKKSVKFPLWTNSSVIAFKSSLRKLNYEEKTLLLT